MILSTTYIQDETTTTLVVFMFVCMAGCILSVKWIMHNKKDAEKNNEYYNVISSDFRLIGAILILLMGLIATIAELIKRI